MAKLVFKVWNVDRTIKAAFVSEVDITSVIDKGIQKFIYI